MVPFNYIAERSTNTVNSRAPRRRSSKPSEKVHGSSSSGISHNGGNSGGSSLVPPETSKSSSSLSKDRDNSAVMQTREAVKFRTMPYVVLQSCCVELRARSTFWEQMRGLIRSFALFICSVSLLRWFHGSITRHHSEQLLTPHKDGKFLVRESQAFAHQRNLTLCVS